MLATTIAISGSAAQGGAQRQAPQEARQPQGPLIDYEAVLYAQPRMIDEMMADVLPFMRERRFAFDLELFVLAKRRGFTDLHPAPVELGERLAGSTVTTKAVVRTLRDSLTIWKRLNIHGAYPRPAVPATTIARDLAHLQAAA